ncbi:MAG: hypothetical protein IPK44_24405 [Candidatus Accumulibacter sp.]|jgi:hypothetical protein|uniref:hypothetical protein n=1 Tax=Accumulibacter sp. TaxID=2053492 RepID=UPI00258C6658|nr:hypothetical protein [Accumulibacter sp.]MBK8117432.1 hypothetical protein [Accumulibacter sp.]
MKTFEEICEILKGTDEITLLEQLDISSEEIVEKFRDLIEDKLEFFQQDLEDEEDDDS